MKDITKKLPIVLLSLLLIPSLIFNLFLYKKIKKTDYINQVDRVIDGDTFVLEWGQRVRLRSVDASELDSCGGQEAKQRLEQLILGKNVDLKDNFTDAFGRIQAFVYVEGLFINEILVREGWGKYDSNKSAQSEVLKAAFQEAQENKKGIFSTLCHQTVNPDNPKCNIKGNIEKNSDKKWYFFLGCQSYEATIVEKERGEDWFCTEKEAQAAGFKKGTSCEGKVYN